MVMSLSLQVPGPTRLPVPEGRDATYPTVVAVDAAKPSNLPT